jgi:hypothetical protein
MSLDTAAIMALEILNSITILVLLAGLQKSVPKSCPSQDHLGQFQRTQAHNDLTASPLRGKALRALRRHGPQA